MAMPMPSLDGHVNRKKNTLCPLTHRIQPTRAVEADCWAPVWSHEQLQQEQRSDPAIGFILTNKEQGKERPPEMAVSSSGPTFRSLWAQWNRLELEQGLLYRYWEQVTTGDTTKQLVVPRTRVEEILQALHNGTGGGHFGRRKTLEKVRARFYWPGLREDVEDWCLRCRDCAQSKNPVPNRRGPLSLSQVGYPMERVALDILGPLPVSKHGNRYIIVISDYFTRWVEAFSLPNQEAATVAKTLVEEWICRFGAPDAIHTDQGKNFESQLFAEMCRMLGVKTRTTPYHPQSDGLVERFNRTLRTMLTTHMEQVPEDTWDDELPMLMLAYRSSVQETTQFTPYRLMFGREGYQLTSFLEEEQRQAKPTQAM